MSIIYEHGDELELWKSFTILGCCDNVASVPKAPFIIYSRISHFGHACPEIKNVLIPRLTGKRAIIKKIVQWTC